MINFNLLIFNFILSHKIIATHYKYKIVDFKLILSCFIYYFKLITIHFGIII